MSSFSRKNVYGGELLEANIWGLLFYVCEIEQEIAADGNPRVKAKGIHLYALLGRLLVFLAHAHQIYAAMGYDGTLEMRVSLERMRGIPFLHSSFGGFYGRRAKLTTR
jgi:hypothetical protein